MDEQLIRKKREARYPKHLGTKFVSNPLIRDPQLDFFQTNPEAKFNGQILFQSKQNECQFLFGPNYPNLHIFINNSPFFLVDKVPTFCAMAIKRPFSSVLLRKNATASLGFETNGSL